MSWKEHDYEVDLGVVFSEEPVSLGEDWIEDCEEDDVFDLKPEWFKSKQQYDAALQLCRACSGWFYFDNEAERDGRIELLREIVTSEESSPLRYYDINYGSFDWVKALRENNEKYRDSLYSVENTWSLFNVLAERSLLEKADVFVWLIEFFGDYIQYESRNSLSDQFVSGYGDDLAIMFALKPDLIDKFIKGQIRVSEDCLSYLSKAAAGLIRYGRKEEGTSLYSAVFEEAKNRKVTSEIRKAIIDGFIERLSKGYDDEPYIDDEVANIIINQANGFSEQSWKNKIETIIRRNRKGWQSYE